MLLLTNRLTSLTSHYKGYNGGYISQARRDFPPPTFLSKQVGVLSIHGSVIHHLNLTLCFCLALEVFMSEQIMPSFCFPSFYYFLQLSALLGELICSSCVCSLLWRIHSDAPLARGRCLSITPTAPHPTPQKSSETRLNFCACHQLQ